jgi:hypothetical protein
VFWAEFLGFPGSGNGPGKAGTWRPASDLIEELSVDREDGKGICEHCKQQFGYALLHAGFAEAAYAYCDTCGKTAILSLWDKRMPRLPDCPGQQEMCSAMEQFLKHCDCGGRFRRGAKPRCPHCRQELSAELATNYLEGNAPGTKKGWRWQKNWSALYCIVIEGNRIANNFN